MRKRYQKGSLSKVEGVWIAQWREAGHRRKRTLGRVSTMTKTDAQAELAKIVAPINVRQSEASDKYRFEDFVKDVFLPFYKRKWKPSTLWTNEDRIRFHLTDEFGSRTLGSLSRNELQEFLDRKAKGGLSFSTVDHLRWDLRQIFELARAEGFVNKNPATLLFTPRTARTFDKRYMTKEDVQACFSTLNLRERLIVKFAVLAGMRPGEIFGLKWACLDECCADVRQRIYRGEVDSPKTKNSIRRVALPKGLAEEIQTWRRLSADTSADAWVFPSENSKTPVAKDNVWRGFIAPKLKDAGLDWVTFQVMRRTHSSLMKGLNVDPKTVADQLGHTLDVNQNIYTQVPLERRKEAVDILESALQIA